MFAANANLLLTFAWLSLSAGVLLPGTWLLIGGQLHSPVVNRLLQCVCPRRRSADHGGISKSYFLYFYLVGLVINLSLFVLHLSSFVLFPLFLLHICRRVYECLHMHTDGSQTKVSFLYYFLQLIHYPCVGVTIVVDCKFSYSDLTLSRCFLALIVFFNASYVQHHVRAARAKRTPVAHGHWLLDHLTSPNHLAEMLIYVAFYIASYRTSAMAALLVWVFVSQTLSAVLNHRWDCQRDPNVGSTKRYALVPFLL